MTKDEPKQRFAARPTLPPTKSNRPRISNKAPNLKPVEQTLFIVMSQPKLYHLVDEFRGVNTKTSAMEQALRRRGVTVRRIPFTLDKTLIQVWAKWEHPVPTEVSPWMVDHKTQGSTV